METSWETCITAQGFLEAIAIHLLLRGKKLDDVKGIAMAISIRMLLEKAVDAKKNSLAEHRDTVKVSVAAGMAIGMSPVRIEHIHIAQW